MRASHEALPAQRGTTAAARDPALLLSEKLNLHFLSGGPDRRRFLPLQVKIGGIEIAGFLHGSPVPDLQHAAPQHDQTFPSDILEDAVHMHYREAQGISANSFWVIGSSHPLSLASPTAFSRT
jgi:hypothetical protein